MNEKQQVVNSREQEQFLEEFNGQMHRLGRVTLIAAAILLITLPFVIEGIFIGLLASGIAFFVEWYFYGYIETMVMSDLQMITIVTFSELKKYVLAGFVALGIFTGIVGSSISLGKYLKS